MIRVLLVDDEYLIRERIKKTIPFAENGFEIVGEAQDGNEALSLVESLKPDLLVLDINIPFLNGLELSKAVMEKHPNIKIIILTGYSEFQYAQECVRLGVSDYIVKPIDKQKFSRVLNDIKEKILAERNMAQYMENLERKAMSFSTGQKDKQLYGILSDPGQDAQSLTRYFEHNEPGFSGNNVCVWTIDFFQTDEKRLKEANSETSAAESLRKPLAEICHCVQAQAAEGRVVLILGDAHSGKAISKEDFAQIFEAGLPTGPEQSGSSVTVGVGGFRKGLGGIFASYRESLSALEEKFFLGGNRFILFDDIACRERMVSPLIMQKEIGKFDVYVRCGNREGYLEIIRDLRNRIMEANVSPKIARIAYIDFINIAVDFILESLPAEAGAIENEISDFIDTAYQKETLDDLNGWLIQLCDNAVFWGSQESRSHSFKTVDRIMEFIAANYSDPNISIEDIAKSNFISASYLSKIFKKKMNRTIIEYLNEYRLRKAKELIDSRGKIPIGYVAGQVGYSDPFYFSRLFKKAFGISPSLYMDLK